MRRFLHDLLLPHLHNNYRSRALHNKSLGIAIIFLFAGGFLLSTLRVSMPSVLGISTDITGEELLVLTNEKRHDNGAGSLTMNSQLSQAASQKASNMFAENYWAHNSPSGNTPWVFIKNSGYQYVYAGENLAKGFTSSKDTIKAWMASPSHRENMLSKNYMDVGFAVKEGKLLGEDTVLIVEEFGNTTLAQNENQTAAAPPQSSNTQSLVLNSQTQKPLINISSFSESFVLIFAVLFISILILDMLVIERKKITRFVGHNLDHVFFFSIIVLIMIIIARGAIL
ncbi:MAG TPA: CAP domain-containing protein [Patescibacteria group bacterium]|nr:CAP domain-containing protein [Patescibacteria group bacterium]